MQESGKRSTGGSYMNKTAIVIVDLVYDFTNPLGKIYYPLNAELLPRIREFVTEARKLGSLIIYMQHTVTPEIIARSPKKTRECCLEGSGGELIDERLQILPEDLVIKKAKYSSFFNTSLKEELNKRDITTIVVVGTKTNNCVYATVLDAYNLDIRVFVPRELVGTADLVTNNMFLHEMDKYLCEVKPAEWILHQLREETL